MTGQDAVQTAVAFHDSLSLDGVILTKLDGDARGGAALSVREVVGKPIAFVSTGERPSDFETFHPERMASRILGMGDVLSLIERAERTYDEESAGLTVEKMRSGKFSIGGLPRPAPADEAARAAFEHRWHVARDAEGDSQRQDRRRGHHAHRGDHPLDDAQERDNPSLINGSRRTRIAKGSGTSPQEVNDLLRRFKEMQKLMRSGVMGAMARPGRRDKRKGGRVTASGTR